MCICFTCIADEYERTEKRQRVEEKERRDAKRKESLPPGPRIPDEVTLLYYIYMYECFSL